MSQGDQLLELAATNLGVIEHLSLVFGPGMTAITGETGAGKTLVVTALDLLIGGRAEATMVGPHDDEAVVEGRFLHAGVELVLQRVIPRDGRSRAYVNGRLATASTLSEHGTQLVELHGQHGQTALTALSAQRAALDLYGDVDLAPLVEARLHERDLLEHLAGLGGDERARLREVQLARFQVEEIDEARIESAEEDVRLQEQELLLAGATAHRDHVELAVQLLGGDGPADEAISQVLAAIEGAPALKNLTERVRDLSAELGDVATEARALADNLEADPELLAQLQERRRLLTDLRRKYGDTLAEVLEFQSITNARLQELEDRDRLAAEIDGLLEQARAKMAKAEAKVGKARRKAAPSLANDVALHVRELALPKAEVECHVGDDPGDDVEFRVSMNAGAPPQALAKIASGGELARTMLALRLVLSADPATMVFDEVDAGVGGAAAQAVGVALGRLGAARQILVVTHLAQVAAYADNQIVVAKNDDGGMVSVEASALDTEARIVELSRMLSGSPGSASAREHAGELLTDAAAQKAAK